MNTMCHLNGLATEPSLMAIMNLSVEGISWLSSLGSHPISEELWTFPGVW